MLSALTAFALATLSSGGETVISRTAARSKLGLSLENVASGKSSGWLSVIARFDRVLDSAAERRISDLDGYIYRHLQLVRSAAIRIPSRNLARLAALPFVARVSSDAEVRKSDEFTVASSGADTAFQQFGITGRGVGVAIVDSGVYRHPDFDNAQGGRTRIVRTVDFLTGNSSPVDPCGHGTHVAGIIAGNGARSSGTGYFRTFYGVARSADIVNLRVLNVRGVGTVSNVIAAIQWAVEHKSAHNIRVLNLSLGHQAGESYTTDPLCQAVEAAWKAGIVVVCAAGNGGRKLGSTSSNESNEGYGSAHGSIQSPANSPYVITVGATKSLDGVRRNDRIATYSGRGPTRLDFILKPDIVAPGNRVISLNSPYSYLENAYGNTNTIPRSYFSYTGGGGASASYFRLSGTSMATPVVSAGAALLLQNDPTLTPDTVKARLMVSADRWAQPDGTTDPLTFGAGYLNIRAALSSTAIATQYAISPRLIREADGTVRLDSAALRWSGLYVWGMDGAESADPIYEDQLIWGTDTIANSQLIWGTEVWEDQLIWGTDSSGVDLSGRAITGEQ